MGWSIEQMPEQTGKTVLITGANSGIGFEAAKALATKGAEVILACRNPQKGEAALAEIQQALPAAKVSLMALDLASLKSVEEFSAAFKERYKKLDILINNAGVMASPFAKTADGFENQFGTNHLGHFALTGYLLPLLEAADAGRIVVVSSVAHILGRLNFNNLNAEKSYFRWLAYGQSKLANLVFAKELQRRLARAGSKVIAAAAHPGYTATNLQRYTPGGDFINSLMSQTQDQGCLPSLFAATEPSIKGGDYIGPDGFLELRGKPKHAFSTRASKNEKNARKLWEVSERLTNVSYLSAA